MAVVGGGDTAIEEALFLTRFATKVHADPPARRAARVEDHAGARARQPKIEFAWNATVDEVLGDEYVTGVRVRDVKTDEIREPADRGAVRGDRPRAEHRRSCAGSSTLDPVGYIEVEQGTTRTNVEGVFACGDAMDPVYRQAVTAAGTGCMAAIDAERWLAEHGIG